MKNKTFIKNVLSLGGIIDPFANVDFPKTLKITNKAQAISLLEIMRFANDLEDTSIEYAVSVDEPLNALIKAIKQEPIHLFDIFPDRLPDLFKEFDKAMERRNSA